MSMNYLKEQSDIILKKLELKEQLLDKLIDKVTRTYEKNSTSLIAKKTLENLSSNLNNYDQFDIYDKTIIRSNLIQQNILNEEIDYVIQENEQLKIIIFNYHQALNKLMNKYHEHIDELIKHDAKVDVKKIHLFYLKEISIREEIIETIKNRFYNLAKENQQLIEQNTIKMKYLTEENTYLKIILRLEEKNNDFSHVDNISMNDFNKIMMDRKMKIESRRKDSCLTSNDSSKDDGDCDNNDNNNNDNNYDNDNENNEHNTIINSIKLELSESNLNDEIKIE